MSDRLFKMSDVLVAFPWLKKQCQRQRTLSRWVEMRWVELSVQGDRGPGNGHRYSLPQLVHFAVFAELIRFGYLKLENPRTRFVIPQEGAGETINRASEVFERYPYEDFDYFVRCEFRSRPWEGLPMQVYWYPCLEINSPWPQDEGHGGNWLMLHVRRFYVEATHNLGIKDTQA